MVQHLSTVLTFYMLVCMQLQASLQELEAEKTGLAVKLEEKVKLYLDLQVHHSALSATTAAEQQALLDIIEAGKRKLVEQQVIPEVCSCC